MTSIEGQIIKPGSLKRALFVDPAGDPQPKDIRQLKSVCSRFLFSCLYNDSRCLDAGKNIPPLYRFWQTCSRRSLDSDAILLPIGAVHVFR
jgi:hypothetical protein